MALEPSTYIKHENEDKDIEIKFKDEPKYHYSSYVGLYLISETTTLESARLYGRTDYNCTIIGDGEIQHWGILF